MPKPTTEEGWAAMPQAHRGLLLIWSSRHRSDPLHAAAVAKGCRRATAQVVEPYSQWRLTHLESRARSRKTSHHNPAQRLDQISAATPVKDRQSEQVELLPHMQVVHRSSDAQSSLKFHLANHLPRASTSRSMNQRVIIHRRLNNATRHPVGLQFTHQHKQLARVITAVQRSQRPYGFLKRNAVESFRCEMVR